MIEKLRFSRFEENKEFCKKVQEITNKVKQTVAKADTITSTKQNKGDK